MWPGTQKPKRTKWNPGPGVLVIKIIVVILIVDFSLQDKKYDINCEKLANLLVHTHHYLGSENVFSHI